MLGDLDPAYFRFTRWFVAQSEEQKSFDSIAMLYSGLRLPVLLTHGDANGLEAAVERAVQEIPGTIYTQMEEDHDVVLARYYKMGDVRSMIRMGLNKEDFSFRADTESGDVVQLSHADTADLMELYSFYPDAFFEPYQLETGYYFGIRVGERLAAVAGVHVISEEFQVAAIGNIVTHPDFRGRGLAQSCVSHLVTKLFERVDTIALNVPEENHKARKTFESLGFSTHTRFLEGVATRRVH